MFPPRQHALASACCHVDGQSFRVCERARLSSRASERYGRIVNVTSIAAIGWAMLGNSFHAVTKVDVVILTQRITMEFGSHGMTANAVGPGGVRPEMAQDWALRAGME
jgi:NAD(P)-dependent dehydrogenase (short-subunit alcohol dehydrogenase family)